MGGDLPPKKKREKKERRPPSLEHAAAASQQRPLLEGSDLLTLLYSMTVLILTGIYEGMYLD